jgi:hypothetical protein
MKCGTYTLTKLVTIRKIAAGIGIVACHALIALHSFTRCDTVNVYAGTGKASPMNPIADRECRSTYNYPLCLDRN